MGFWQRLVNLEEKIDPVRVALIGDDCAERKRLEVAYSADPRTKINFSGPTDDLKKAARTSNVELVELFAPVGQRAELCGMCLDAGVNVSAAMPPAENAEAIDQLKEKAEQRSKFVRVRNECLYYEPYQKARELIADEKVGWGMMLKLIAKHRNAPARGFDRGTWLLENESGYLALAEYLYGPVEKIFMLGGESAVNPGSTLVGLKFKTPHRLGYMLIDFAPELQVRTFNEPVFRQVWATGTAGVLMVNRGEGQLWRAPVLWLRAKDYSRTWEMLKDDWNLVYPAMAEETYQAVRNNRPVISGLASARTGIVLSQAAGRSLKETQEISV
jgi:predicted dehydrogenase